MKRNFISWTPALLLAAVIALPLVVVAVARSSAGGELDELSQRAEPVLGTLTARTITDERRISVQITWTEGTPLRAPSWSGVVTEVSAAPGDVLRTGSPILEVSGVGRIAAATAAPFYRRLESGNTGKDVADLNAMLTTLGLIQTGAHGDTDTFTSATAAGVRKLAESLGATGQVFDPAWVVWLPREEYELGRLAAVVGAPAPAPGAELAQEKGTIAAAAVAAANSVDSLDLDPAVEWVAILRDREFSVDPVGPAIATTAFAELAAGLDERPERIDGSVRRREELEVFALPSSAISTGQSGLCIWLADESGYRAVAVEALSARGGVTNIARAAGLTTHVAVLANPAQVLDNPQCP